MMLILMLLMKQTIIHKKKYYISIKALLSLPEYASYLLTPRKIIKDYEIKEDKYIFISTKNNREYKSKKENKKAIVYFEKEFFDNFFEIEQKLKKKNNEDNEKSLEYSKRRSVYKSKVPVFLDKNSKQENSLPVDHKPSNQENTSIILFSEVNQPTPPLIILKDNEHLEFNGKKWILELRGEREPNKIFISISSVGKIFGVVNLVKNILETKTYQYHIFNVTKEENEKPITKKKYYFDYNTFLKYAFNSRKPNAEILRKYFSEKLFVHQFGTKQQKVTLARELLNGVSPDNLKKVLKIFPSSLSCIYLLILGTVKDLRVSMNIDPKYSDDMIICKYGKTNDMKRRINEHTKSFSKYSCNITIKYCSRVDSSLCTKAESFIKDHMKNNNYSFSFEKYEELIVITKKILNDTMKQQYSMIETLFCVENKKMLEKIKDLENENKFQCIEFKNKILEYENKMLKLEHENKMKDIENKMLKLEHENMILKIKQEK